MNITNNELLQGIFIMQFLTFLAALGAFAIYIIRADKEDQKKQAEKLETKIREIAQDEIKKDRV